MFDQNPLQVHATRRRLAAVHRRDVLTQVLIFNWPSSHATVDIGGSRLSFRRCL